MAEEEKPKLFREKSLEAIESPESLNDYLRVTSPGVWLVLAAVIMLLSGAIVWGIFGRLETKAQLAVVSSDGQAICYVPYDYVESVMDQGVIAVQGQEYVLRADAEPEVTIVTEDMNPYIRVKGNLKVGDITVAVPLESTLGDGVYTGTVVTESLQPISLLLQ